MENCKPDFAALKQMPLSLLCWYDERARELPWRENPTPYRVWISEVILQQTRVEAGKKYFERFIDQVPDIQALASIDDTKLFKLWEGLGYYNRAKNLKKAACMLMEQYDGALPADFRELKKLPGIGEYTAGAISSIAFGLRYAAVDGNVMRVLARMLCWNEDVRKEPAKRWAAEQIKRMLPNRAGDFNQALMELGALICRPNGDPLCEQCPVKKLCMAYQTETQDQFPVKAEKKLRKKQDRTVFLLISGKEIAVCQRPKKGLLGSMWEFPCAEQELSKEEAHDWLKEQGIQPIEICPAARHKHIFSHVEWNLSGWLVTADHIPYVMANSEKLQNEIPIPSAFEPYVEQALAILKARA